MIGNFVLPIRSLIGHGKHFSLGKWQKVVIVDWKDQEQVKETGRDL
jgi:thiamine phosphate synthase YjbQ (UPF0047 family)